MKKILFRTLATFCVIAIAGTSLLAWQNFATNAPAVSYISRWSGLTIPETLDVLDSPNENAEIITQLPRNSTINVTAQAGSYMRIQTGDFIGYVHARYIRPIRPDIIPSTYWRATSIQDTMTTSTTPAARNDNVTSRLIIHHTAGLPFTTEDTAATLRRIRETHYFHMTVQNWSDLGYHFIIDGAGRIWEGAAMSNRGTHSGGYFNHDVGIAILGNFHPNTTYNRVQTIPNGQEMTDEQQLALLDLCRWLVHQLELDTVTYGNTDDDRPWLFAPIGMHSDVIVRACPGDNVVPWIESVLRYEINAWVQARSED